MSSCLSFLSCPGLGLFFGEHGAGHMGPHGADAWTHPFALRRDATQGTVMPPNGDVGLPILPGLRRFGFVFHFGSLRESVCRSRDGGCVYRIASNWGQRANGCRIQCGGEMLSRRAGTQHDKRRWGRVYAGSSGILPVFVGIIHDLGVVFKGILDGVFGVFEGIEGVRCVFLVVGGVFSNHGFTRICTD